MTFMRIAHGKVNDAISLGVVFILSFIAVSFIILQILGAGRQRVEVTEDKVKLKLPTWRGPNPFGPVVRAEVPYSEISSVQKRGEIYAFLGVLGLRESSSLVTKDGTRHVLGYITENEADSPMPYDNITNLIANRAGLEVNHIGTVNGGSQLGAAFSKTPSWDTEPIKAEDVSKIRKRAQFVALGLVILLIGLVIGGIGIALYPEISTLLNPA